EQVSAVLRAGTAAREVSDLLPVADVGANPLVEQVLQRGDVGVERRGAGDGNVAEVAEVDLVVAPPPDQDARSAAVGDRVGATTPPHDRGTAAGFNLVSALPAENERGDGDGRIDVNMVAATQAVDFQPADGLGEKLVEVDIRPVDAHADGARVLRDLNVIFARGSLDDQRELARTVG